MKTPRRQRARPRRPGPAGLLVVALAGPLAGCGNDPGVLARVSGQAITVAHFNEVARGNLQQYEGPPDSAKIRLLEDLVRRELLVQGALREGTHETPEFQAFRGTFEQQVLREVLFERLLSGPFPVSEAEIRELYDRRATATRARLIFTQGEALARQAAADLERGDDFVAVADRYNSPGVVPPGGDIGFLQPGTLLAPLDDIVRTGEPGRVFGPIGLGGDGWFLVRVEERRPQSQPPLEEERARLEELLRQRKRRGQETRVLEGLRREYAVEVLAGAAQFMVGKLRAAPGIPAPPAPDPEDRARVLVHYQGGTYTLGEAYDALLSGAGGRLDFAMLPTVQLWLESQAIDRVAVLEARRRGLADEPRVRDRIRDRLNNYLLDGYYQRQVIERIRIGPEDLRAAYERFRASFERLLSARVISVMVSDSAAAAVLAEQAGRAPDLRQAASIAGLGEGVAEEGLTFPADSPLWTQFEFQLTGMQPGQLAGPFPVETGWLVFQLVEKRQVAPEFDDLPAATRGQLQGVATELKREERLLVLTDSLRQALAPVVVHHERLRRLPWPPAGAGPPGT